MKYHVSVDCQESYIFPRDYIFPKCCSTEGKSWRPPTRDGFHPSRVRYLKTLLDGPKWMISLPLILWSSISVPQSLVTKLGVCIQNKTERKLDSLRAFYYDVLLLTIAYSAYARAISFWVTFANMELMLWLCVAFIFFTELLYFCDCVTSTCYTRPVFDRLSMHAWTWAS